MNADRADQQTDLNLWIQEDPVHPCNPASHFAPTVNSCRGSLGVQSLGSVTK